MKDLIDRQAAIRRYCGEHCGCEPQDCGLTMLQDGSGDCDFVRFLKEEPSAEPERKKGHWVPVDSLSAFGGDESAWISRGNPIAFYYCSECKEQAYAGEDGESLLTDFCPDCGADMRGEEG